MSTASGMIEVGNGVHLAYLDSGIPPSASVYTTFLILHGFGWNAHIFQKTVDVAPSHGVRIIALHRRNYGSSTAFSDDELNPLKAGDARQTDAIEPFMDKRAIEIATFIQKVVHSGGILKSERGAGGGIVLVGWSIGNVFGLDFLARISRLPTQLQDCLRAYVSGYVVYDPPLDAVGISTPHPSGVSFVRFLIQRAIASGGSPEEAVNNWLSSWNEYPHPDSADLEERYDHFNDSPRTRASLRQLEADDPEFRACMSFECAATDHILMALLFMRSYEGALAKTLYADPEEMFWSGMKVEYLYCANSPWNIICGADGVRERFEGAVLGRKVRLLDNANHFVHWVDADRFLDTVISLT